MAGPASRSIWPHSRTRGAQLRTTLSSSCLLDRPTPSGRPSSGRAAGLEAQQRAAAVGTSLRHWNEVEESEAACSRKTKICDTHKGSPNVSNHLKSSNLCCPGTLICRMGPVDDYMMYSLGSMLTRYTCCTTLVALKTHVQLY
jgi:hypothetical protein